MNEINARDAKLVQYLNEAYGKEKQLETALEAHIAMTARDTYKKRLQQHLRETKDHARQVERRIKQLGGTADVAPDAVPEGLLSDAASKVTEVAQRGVALAQGPLHAVRGTSEEEKQLKNAKDEFSDEAQEIATYRAIETLADTVGDRQTARIARSIRRQEERMASFLERLIPTLTKAMAQAEIPASLRNGGSRRATSRRKSTGTTRRKTTGTARRKTTGTRRKTTGTARRKTTGTRRKTTGTSRRKTTARRTTGSRTTAKRRTTGTRRATSSRRTTARRTARSSR